MILQLHFKESCNLLVAHTEIFTDEMIRLGFNSKQSGGGWRNVWYR